MGGGASIILLLVLAGPYVAGGPVGPDGTLNKVLEPFEHSILDQVDPAGQHAVMQEVLES